MLVSRDQASELDQRSTERMNFRIKEVIQRAAALSGVDDPVFTMNAACKAALETIAAHERTVLQTIDHVAFFAALNNPPLPTDKLRAAFVQFQDMAISR